MFDVSNNSSPHPSQMEGCKGERTIFPIDDVFRDPTLLHGKTPSDVESGFSWSAAWKVEGLRKGNRRGEGWVLREYRRDGKLTGRLIRWHPGGGHHGPDPYWRVASFEGKSDIIR